jgi:hypothetical protein
LATVNVTQFSDVVGQRIVGAKLPPFSVVSSCSELTGSQKRPAGSASADRRSTVYVKSSRREAFFIGRSFKRFGLGRHAKIS